MPTYEYACRSCGQHLEVVQSFRDDPLTECPNCAGELRKVFQPVGIAFKGSGFYKNDSRSKSSSSTPAGSSESKSSESKTGDSSSSSSSSSSPSSSSSGDTKKSDSSSSSSSGTSAAAS